MASLQEIKERIKAANDIGRLSLAEKGVTLPGTATTCEIMQGIKDVKVTSGSVETLYDPEGVGF